MPALALDIGSYSIKAILGKPGKTVEVERAVEVLNTTGVVIPTEETASEKLTAYLQTFFTDHNLSKSDLRLSLPESQVSTKIIEIPPLNDAELASAIGWQAEQHIPIPLEELSLEYEVLYRPKKNDNEKMRVLMIGVRKDVITRYLNVFLDLGVEPKLLETQSLSVLRSLQFTTEDQTSLVVHMGASSMDLYVVSGGELRFVFTTLQGSALLTKTLEQSIGLDANQAEEYKRSYGLDPQQFEGKIRKALLPALDTLVNEMRKAMQFYSHQQPQDKITRIILSGGGVQLTGILEYITEQLGVEVLLSAPFAQSSGEIPNNNHSAYSVCMGALIREL